MSHYETDRTVTASFGGGDIPVWTTGPSDGRQPGLLLIPAIFGVDEGTKTLARDLAFEGAHVWVVDPFWRTSPGVIARDKEGFGKGIARARKIENDVATGDFADVVRAIAKEEGCNSQVAVLGLCFAGKFAVLLTSEGLAAAGASFHGPGIAAISALEAKISVPLSMHFGDADVAIPVTDVAVIRQAFAGHSNVEVVLHEGGVNHGFGDPGSDGFHPLVYQTCLKSVRRLLDGLRSIN